MKLFLQLVLLPVALIFISGCSQQDSVTAIKLAHGLDISHPVHKGMVYFAEQVAERSNGQMRIDIYPSGQLGSERQCLELLQIGSLGMTKVSAAVLENFAPRMKVLGLPYLFRDDEHAWAVLNGPIGKGLLLEAQNYWLRGVCFYDAGSRSFYTKDRPINSPDDLDGLKVRVMNSQTAMQMVKALGGAPTPISFGELYTALQQGVVDGAENNPPSFYTSRHYEVCKYYSIDEHSTVPDVMLIGTNTWERLTAQEQTWLQEAADASVEYQRKVWAASEQEALDAVKAAGVQINYPDKSPFAARVEDIYERYKDDPEIYELIQQIQAVQ
ncbi:MAG: TRAP transporter substrate-binding protein [Phaeodactylibacter xiamenensis]|uniref:C4-dicarboxylate ABC transporter substrate-binding protein n=1 Tax=Phaeodactylibacter xiamenensis TaxID=1524460 RepID=A0A098S684_9BACT|nr:TRAP transporter substrate-binding protein [Phaeodactylibacter xiamenensis]KGE86742.1 C4-dicarboxylate ABC transporter substrate-binding protein [Phaeodactylibacter xiamenensis]MCR9052636.1 TRAP transporter substrate-binding protein [bacterium]